MTRRSAARGVALLALALAVGCATHVAPAVYGDLPAVLAASSQNSPGGFGRTKPPISHVVIVIQENRSFDNLFQGFPGADTQSWGKDSHGKTIALQPVPLEATYDIEHDFSDFTSAYDGGKMDGFDKEVVYGRYPSNPEYGYVPASETKPYFDIGEQYVVADRMFTSHLDASFVSHQYIIAGQAHHAVDLPSSSWGCDGGREDTVATLTQHRTIGPSEVVCFPSKTLGDELDAAGLSWRYYAADPLDGWEPFQAIRHIRYGPDWKKMAYPSSKFLTDVQNGDLAAVTWIAPTCATSDHSGCESNKGPAWVASVVDAVGGSKFWDSSVIFVMWDEWGGWYDHVPPPQLDYDGLGIRVPLLIVSPYAKRGYVSHVRYEHGSILRYIEDNWGLPQLAASDQRANDPATDAFDYTQKPRRFRSFPHENAALNFPDFRPADGD